MKLHAVVARLLSKGAQDRPTVPEAIALLGPPQRNVTTVPLGGSTQDNPAAASLGVQAHSHQDASVTPEAIPALLMRWFCVEEIDSS